MDGGINFVAGALSSTPEKAKASGRELGLADERNYGTWEEMLERESSLPEGERIAFVSVVTPNHMHFPIAHAFAEAGFNVVSDKPMVHTSEQANHAYQNGGENGRRLRRDLQLYGLPARQAGAAYGPSGAAWRASQGDCRV